MRISSATISPIRFIAVLVMSIIASSALLRTASGAHLETKRSGVPTVPVATSQEWVNQFISGDEIWLFRSEGDWRKLLSNSKLPTDVANEVARLLPVRWDKYPPAMDPNWILNLQTARTIQDAENERIISIPVALKSKLPKEFLTKAYLNQLQSLRAPLHMSFNSLPEAEKRLLELGIQRGDVALLLDKLLPISGKHYLFLTPEIKKLLSPQFINKVARQFLEKDPRKRGLEVTLHVRRGDDIEQIAKDYSNSDRQAKAVTRYLKSQLSKSSDLEISVPLERILPKYIQKNINTYSVCEAANCARSSLNVTSTKKERTSTNSYIHPPKMVDHLGGEFTMLNPDQPLQVGDIFTYFDANGSPVHFASYVGKDLHNNTILFTKNGFDTRSPFIYQTRDQVETVYANAKKLVVFRRSNLPTNPSEQVFSYRYHPPINAFIIYKDSIAVKASPLILYDNVDTPEAKRAARLNCIINSMKAVRESSR